MTNDLGWIIGKRSDFIVAGINVEPLRTSLDGTTVIKEILTLTVDQLGYIWGKPAYAFKTTEQVVELMSTPEWTDPSGF